VDHALSLPLPLTDATQSSRQACPPDEAAWARAAAGGDKGSFGKLVERHKASVYGLCWRLLGPQGGNEEARDAAQEAFVRAYTSLSSFDPRQPFAAWVLRIAHNHCIDVLRRRRPTLSLVPEARGEEAAEPGVSFDLPDRFARSGEDVVQEREAQRDLERAVASLAPRYREVIALYHVQHRSYAEIADTLDVPLGTVMTWLHRARKELKVRLSEHLS
jgi:RNA polymerase sigma-70 factor (ECF subfamily)